MKAKVLGVERFKKLLDKKIYDINGRVIGRVPQYGKNVGILLDDPDGTIGDKIREMKASGTFEEVTVLMMKK